MNPLFIDIETYCQLNVTKVGAYRLAEDPGFEILLVCWNYKGVPGEWRIWETRRPPQAFLDAIAECDFAVAFNANFERVCFSSNFGKNLRLPARLCERKFWKCAQARALCSGLPAKMMKASLAIDPGWTQHHLGHRAMLKLSKPRRPTKKNPDTRWLPSFCPADYDNLVEYCHQDVKDEMDLWYRTRDLSDSEWRLYWLDQKINDRGVRIDLRAVEAAQIAGATRKLQLNNKAQQLVGTNLSQVARLADYLGRKSLTADSIVDILADPEGSGLNDVQLQMVRLRQEYAKTSVTKLDAMLRSVCADGRVRGMFQFAGAAATNRWAGRIVQLQNLPRAGVSDIESAIEDVLSGNVGRLELLYGDVMGLLSAMIRGMLVPEAGNVLNLVDYSAVEAVVLGWLADCTFYMDELSGEGKLYEKMAGEIYGLHKSQIGKKSPKRFLGKTAVLGCGFQMGEDKFVVKAIDDGSEEPESVLRAAHAAYRANVPEIANYDTGLWAKMNNAAVYAVENPGTVVQIANGRIKFGVEGEWLYMVLPSGRPLAYFHPEIRRDEKFNRNGVTYMGVNSYTSQWERLRTYGGKLTENAVQAIARDLLADAMLRMDDAGHDIIMHVHDEPVTESSGSDIAAIEEIMCNVPDWAAGMPIRAEGETVTRYKK